MSKPVILCVDDEDVVLISLRDQLTHYLGNEYTVEIAESGEEALEVLEELLQKGIEIPLIISDQIMPGIKGDELLIKVHDRYPNALKIFLTGQADAAAVGNAVNNANLYRYIAKPWDEADLKLTVTKALYSYARDKQITEQNKLLEKLYAQAQKEIVERKRVESLLAEANQTLEQKVKERTRELSRTLDDLRKTQDQLIVQEKMASLGMLTSGIAHEIKNPLNFINSFSSLSVDLARELKEIIDSEKNSLDSEVRESVSSILKDLQSNAASINEEGRRADSIIRSMLTHSPETKGRPRKTNLNALLGEAVNLACHSMRGKDTYFDIRIETDYAPDLGTLNVISQDISRVFVNLVNNAYYATRKKKTAMGDNYTPTLTVRTRNLEECIEIRIRDNGTGIPAQLQPEIFNPFFTTKPSGEGAGLGLSISHDIIVQGHQGTIEVDTDEGEYTEFIITLPK